MKKNFISIFLLFSAVSFAQIGINTANPKATLDIVGSPKDLTKVDGVIAPRISGNELASKDALYTSAQTGIIIYVTSAVGTTTSKTVNVTTPGYYYFDGTVWIKMTSQAVTADNGLTKTGNNMQLGGTLLQNTNIATSGFNTTFSGTGNVGIGTTLPTQKLEVVGNGKFINSNNLVEVITNTLSPGLSLLKNGTANLSNPTVLGFINFGGRTNNTDNQAMATIVSEYKGNGTNNLSNLEFRTSGTVDTDMILSESGDLGVGNNILPTQKLDVDGNVRLRQVPENTSIDTNDRVMILDNTGVAKKVPLSSVQSTVTSDNGLTKTGNNVQLGGTLLKNTEIATAGFNTTFSGTGNVGLGVIPTKKLDVDGDTYLRGRLNLFGNYDDGATLIVKNKTADKPIATFAGSGTSPYRAYLLDNGNFGLGVTDPSENLDVGNNVRVRGINANVGVSTDRIVVADGNGVLKSVPGNTFSTQTLTANNGITLSGNNIQLGGALVQNTDIATAGFNTTFSGAGNLGLGVVPTKKLDVDGDTYLRGRLNLAAAYDDGATLIVKNKTAGNWIASFAGSGTNPYRAVLLDNGNFGLGTISPDSSLHILESSQPGSNQMKIESITNAPRLVLERTGTSNLANSTVLGEISFNGHVSGADFPLAGIKSNYWGNGLTNSSSLTFRTSDADQVLINEFGNTGFGTVGPSEKVDVNGKLRVRDTSILADTNAKPLFVNSNGVVGTLNESGPKTLFMDASAATTNVTDNASSFNAGEEIRINLAASNVRLNTLRSTVNQNEIVLAESGFYLLSASLTTYLSAQAGNNIFQVFNVEKSSDNGATWSSISGLREIHNIPPMFTGSQLRFYIVTPSVVVQLQANDRIRLITFRPVVQGNGTLLGDPVTSFSISGIAQQGTRAYTLGITKL